MFNNKQKNEIIYPFIHPLSVLLFLLGVAGALADIGWEAGPHIEMDNRSHSHSYLRAVESTQSALWECYWSVGGSQRTHGPRHGGKEHANSTQRGPDQYTDPTSSRFAANKVHYLLHHRAAQTPQSSYRQVKNVILYCSLSIWTIQLS